MLGPKNKIKQQSDRLEKMLMESILPPMQEEEKDHSIQTTPERIRFTPLILRFAPQMNFSKILMSSLAKLKPLSFHDGMASPKAEDVLKMLRNERKIGAKAKRSASELKAILKFITTEPACTLMVSDLLFAATKKYRKEIAADRVHNNLITNGCSVGSDKSCPREVFMINEHVKCQPCEWTKALMKAVNAEAKSSLKISDFERLYEEYKKIDESSVPDFLDYVETGIGRDIAADSIFSDDILVLARSLFYAVIDEMHRMKLEDINEEILRKWGAVIRDCKKMDLDVQFAEEHLKKIAHAYFFSKELPNLDAWAHTHIVCSMAEMESFEDGAPLSKGILSEPTRAPV